MAASTTPTAELEGQSAFMRLLGSDWALRVQTEPLPDGYVLAEIGFADPHGRAAGDRTYTVLPAGAEAIDYRSTYAERMRQEGNDGQEE